MTNRCFVFVCMSLLQIRRWSWMWRLSFHELIWFLNDSTSFMSTSIKMLHISFHHNWVKTTQSKTFSSRWRGLSGGSRTTLIWLLFTMPLIWATSEDLHAWPTMARKGKSDSGRWNPVSRTGIIIRPTIGRNIWEQLPLETYLTLWRNRFLIVWSFKC